MVLLCSTFNSINFVNCRDGTRRLHGPRSGGRKAGGAGQLIPNMRSHHVHISGSLHNPSCDCLDDMEANKWKRTLFISQCESEKTSCFYDNPHTSNNTHNLYKIMNLPHT